MRTLDSFSIFNFLVLHDTGKKHTWQQFVYADSAVIPF